MIRHLIIVFSLLLFVSCDESTSSETAIEEQPPELFSNFPEQPFLDIEWAESNIDVEEKLFAQGFQLQPGSEDHFYNSEKKIEFVIAEFSTHLVGFKVFLKGEEDLLKKDEYSRFFERFSTENDVTPQFSTYKIDTPLQEYKVTVYSQDDFLRFEFILKSSH